MKFAVRFLSRFVLGGLLVFGAGAAKAGIPVIDVASLAQAVQEVLQSIEQIQNQVRQIQQLQAQYEQLQSNYQAITGMRNLGAILDNPQLRNYIPANAADIMGHVQTNGYSSLSSSAKTLRDAQMVYNCLNLAGAQRSQCQASLSAPYQQKAFMSDAMAAATGRISQIQSLMAQINATPDQKAINEIQARIEAENAMLQHQQTQINMARGLAEADYRIEESRAKEAQLEQAARTGRLSDYVPQR